MRGEEKLGVSREWMTLFMQDALMEDFRSVTFISDLDNQTRYQDASNSFAKAVVKNSKDPPGRIFVFAG